MPNKDPEYYFSEWDNEEFHDWLQDAIKMLIPKLHLLPDDVLERLHGLREVAVRLEHDAESEVQWLYSRITQAFDATRKELKIT